MNTNDRNGRTSDIMCDNVDYNKTLILSSQVIISLHLHNVLESVFQVQVDSLKHFCEFEAGLTDGMDFEVINA